MVRTTKGNPIPIRFSDEDRAALTAIADDEDVSIGQVVRRAVREFLDRRDATTKKPKPKK